MSSYEVRGLDDYTNRMLKKLSKEYPEKTKKFLEYQIGQCKAEAQYRTPKSSQKSKKYKKSKHLKDNWKTKVTVKNGQAFAVLKNASPHAHLIENGHMTKDGGWWEGKHMLENTMTHRQPQIDKAIDKLIDEVFDF